MSVILLIAENEFSRIIRHPVVILTACLLFVIGALNGVASAHFIPLSDRLLNDGNDHFFSISMSNTLTDAATLLFILSMFVGVLSVIEDRFKGSINTLVVKPLYRRDIVLGKFIGLSGIVLLFMIVDVLICTSSIMVFSRGPLDFQDFLLRMPAYTIVLLLGCLLTMSITFLIGTVFKDLFTTLALSGTLLCFEWFVVPARLGSLKLLNPVNFYYLIIDGNGVAYIFETKNSFSMWLSAAFPYAVFMALVIIAILIFTGFVFSREDA